MIHNPLDIMKELSTLIEDSKNIPDVEFFEDRIWFMKKNYNSDIDTYRSDKTEDKENVLDYDLETISILINQVLRFGRIVMSSDNGSIYNFPKGTIPRFEINDIFNSSKHNTIKTNMRKK